MVYLVSNGTFYLQRQCCDQRGGLCELWRITASRTNKIYSMFSKYFSRRVLLYFTVQTLTALLFEFCCQGISLFLLSSLPNSNSFRVCLHMCGDSVKPVLTPACLAGFLVGPHSPTASNLGRGCILF